MLLIGLKRVSEFAVTTSPPPRLLGLLVLELSQVIFLCDLSLPQQAIVDAVLAIRQPDQEIDLHMVEIMEMMHKSDADTKYV